MVNDGRRKLRRNGGSPVFAAKRGAEMTVRRDEAENRWRGLLAGRSSGASFVSGGPAMSLTEIARFAEPADPQDRAVCLAAVLRAGAGLAVGLAVVVIAALIM